MDQTAVDAVILAYEALLLGGIGTAGPAHPVEAMLQSRGIPLRDLLIDAPRSSAIITRADFSELAAVSSLIAEEDWPIDQTHMPNVPKGSRKKSESGIDAMAAELDATGPDAELTDDDLLMLASVKHTLAAKTATLRTNLLASVTTELTMPYLVQQIRVFAGALEKAGVVGTTRPFLHLNDFPQPERVTVHAVAVVDSSVADKFINSLSSLPAAPTASHRFRVICVPELATIHNRCP